MYCEMCFKKKSVKWVLVDENYETELCASCVKALKDAGEPVRELKV